MLVGGSGGGKTAVRNILQKALILLPTVIKESGTPTRMNRITTVDVTVLNPKAMQISELYGAINSDTLEFSDGMVRRSMGEEGNASRLCLVGQCHAIVFENS